MTLHRVKILSAFLLLTLIAAPMRAGAQNEQPITSIAFGSCIKEDQPMPLLGDAADGGPDVFVFLGDNIYGDTQDMQVLSAKYQSLADNEHFQALRASTQILATWDDHDYGVNDGGYEYPMRRESEAVFLDFWKVPEDSPKRSRDGVYGVHWFGPVDQRVQIILLDTRFFRGPLQRGDQRVGGPYMPTEDSDVPMLGEDQWAWLEEQLKTPARLRIIASSIQFVAEDAGQETWSNIPHERRRMVKLIRDCQADGVLFISGDRHWSELSRLDEDTTYPLFDLTSSSINQGHARGTPTDNRFRHLETTYHATNYGRILIDWESESISLEIIDENGEAVIEATIGLNDLSG